MNQLVSYLQIMSAGAVWLTESPSERLYCVYLPLWVKHARFWLLACRNAVGFFPSTFFLGAMVCRVVEFVR